MSRIDILLATYNGARFLPEQLASLAGQTHDNWRLLVRDDGSSDATLDIIREWAKGVVQEVEIIEDGRKGLGASMNFAALMENASAPYFACCDQDDVWLPHKLETLLGAARESEALHGEAHPVLIFGDLFVVDEALAPIAPSYWALSNLDPDRDAKRLADIMVRNVATGCATLGNAALLRAALPVPDGARMHDWWLALAAFSLGSLVPVREPTVKYRQHGSNTIGASKATPLAIAKQFFGAPVAALERTERLLVRSQRQAGAFVDRFGDALSKEDAALLRGYAGLAGQSWAARKRFLLEHAIMRDHPSHRIAMLLLG